MNILFQPIYQSSMQFRDILTPTRNSRMGFMTLEVNKCILHLFVNLSEKVKQRAIAFKVSKAPTAL